MNKPSLCNNEPKLISVIIPVFNGENFIAEAIQNVISQNYSPIEIIVIDDGSTDETELIVQKFPFVKYHFQKHAGPAKARNNALKLAQGELIAYLDCDDLWSHKHLVQLSEILENNNAIEIAEGLIQEMQWDELTQCFLPIKSPFFNCLLGSSLFRKQVFEIVGNFNEGLLFCEDIDWFIRAWENNIQKERINLVSLFYRKHNSNMTNDSKTRLHYRMLLHKLKIDRQKMNTIKRTNSISLKNYLG